MATKSQHLQAMFARRREMEHMHNERTQAVNKYYDHWGKVTARFENWTTPEYYKQADEKLQRTKTEKEKQKQLVERREKLAQLLEQEKEQYNMELKQKSRSRKSRAISTGTLEKIHDNLKEEQNIRRKLELEAKLYGKWRHGVDDERLIFDSKSDHEVIAKLNWLDKQVENQLEREKDELLAKERNLRLQVELNRAEQLHKERQKIREKEIREIRALQEMHMEQMKERQHESDLLREQEQTLNDSLSELEKELELLEESYVALRQPAEFGGAYNLNKIKVFMRRRSEVYRNQIKLCISILERMLPFAHSPEPLKAFKDNLSKQLDSEMYRLSQIDAMYESEAKYNLHRCEELWQQQHTERYRELKDLLQLERNAKAKQLRDVVQRESELIDIRSTHLNAIESTSEQLKQLIKEEEESPRGGAVVSPRDVESVSFSPRNPDCPAVRNCDTPETQRAAGFCGNRHEDHITDTFRNLNLDVWEQSAAAVSPRDLENQRLNAQRSLQVVTSETAARPRFGRKRVAWT